MYSLLLTMHVLSLLGLIFAAGSEYRLTKPAFETHLKNEVRKLERLHVWERVNIISALLILATGFAMVAMSSSLEITTPWVLTSIVLTGVFAVFADTTGRQTKKVIQAELAEPGEDITDKLRQAARQAIRVTVVGLFIIAGLVVLMRHKPEAIVSVAVAIGSVAAGLLAYRLFTKWHLQVRLPDPEHRPVTD